MAKKPTKKSTPTPEYDSERETRVVLEDVNKGIKSIAEGRSVLVRNQQEIKDELQSVKMAVMENSRKMKGLGKGQEEIKQKLDTVTTDHHHRIEKLEAVR